MLLIKTSTTFIVLIIFFFPDFKGEMDKGHNLIKQLQDFSSYQMTNVLWMEHIKSAAAVDHLEAKRNGMSLKTHSIGSHKIIVCECFWKMH